MFHCPWYNSNLEHQGERQAATAMKVMEPLLFQYRTALIASGHVHGEDTIAPPTIVHVYRPVHAVAGNHDIKPSPSGRLMVSKHQLDLTNE